MIGYEKADRNWSAYQSELGEEIRDLILLENKMLIRSVGEITLGKRVRTPLTCYSQ